MTAKRRKLFDIDIQDLTEPYVVPVARLHAECFPEKLESQLGIACVADLLQRRCLGPHPDFFCRVAVLTSDGRLGGYVLSAGLRRDHHCPFITPSSILIHFARRGWTSLRIWRLLICLVCAKIHGRKANREAIPATQIAAGEAASAAPAEFINHVAVAPAVRFGNIGIDLMLDAEEQAWKRGARRVFGMVHAKNTAAQRLYFSIGWKKTFSDAGDLDSIPIHKDPSPPDSPC